MPSTQNELPENSSESIPVLKFKNIEENKVETAKEEIISTLVSENKSNDALYKF